MADGDGATVDLRTVFVKGVSFDWDDETFEGAFSNIGPLRKCFLLKGAGRQHKGCGFATFALKEDAKRAIDELNGKSLGGRTIQVETAQKRAPFSERKEKKRKRSEAPGDEITEPALAPSLPGVQPAPAKAQPVQPSSEQEAKADEKETAQRKKAKTAGKAGKDAQGREAAAAAAKPEGKQEQKQKQKQKPKPKTMPPAASAKQLLVRTVALGNLSSATSAQAVAHAQQATQVESVRMPMEEETSRHMLQQDGCTGDVVFLTYKTVKDAMGAVALLHNHSLQGQDAPVNSVKGKKTGQPGAAQALAQGALLWARQVSGEGAHLKKWRLILRNLPFNVSEAQLRSALSPAGFVWELNVPRNSDGQARGFAFAGFMCRAHAEKAITVANGQVVGGRTIAVDWAVSKTQYKSASAADSPGGADAKPQQSVLDSDSEGRVDGDDMPETEDDGEEANLDISDERKRLQAVLAHFDGGEAAALQGRAQQAAMDKMEDVVEDDVESGDASDEEAELAKGPDPGVGVQHSRADAAAAQPPAHHDNVEATVFVRGLPLDTLQYELQDRMSRFGKLKACRLVKDKTTQKLKGTAFVEFERPEDAERAAAACAKARSGSGPAVAVRGVQLDIDLALTQTGARTLASGRAGTPSKDNRNLYLMKEGQIEDGSAAWQAMSAADRTKRTRAAAEAKLKLKSPNFFVSRTRLCLRNLPHQISEKALKDLVIAAVKERASKAEPTVKQVKILKDADKAGEAKAKSAKSKGFAFVELTDHEHALCALRQLNNNPVPFGTERRPVVEFAIENAQALKKRALRQTRVHEGAAAKSGRGGRPEAGSEAGALAPASRQQQRKRRREEPEGPHTSETNANGKVHTPKEGRGQRQRRKKRDGAGPDGQPGQPSAPSKPGKAAAGAHSADAAGHVAAADVRPAKRLRQTRDPAGGPKGGRGKKSETEKTDRLDNMVAQYKQQLFGSASQSGSIKASMQRWFE